MDDVAALRGADANPARAVVDGMANLELQLAQLTKMVQSGVKRETVSVADRQSVKDALGGLDGGEIFNEAVAVQYQQGKQQQWRSGWRSNSSRTQFMIMWKPRKRPVLCMCLLILEMCRRMRESLFVCWPRTWER